MLGSVQPQPLDNARDGTLPLAAIEAAIKPDDSHFARTRLIALENTIGGRVLPAGYVAAVRALADRRGLALHLDGARLWNAAVKQGVAPRAIAQGFDSVSVCLSKGLGAPVGSLLCGGARFHQGGAPLAQDAGRRHAAGGHSRRGGQLRARASRRAPCRGSRQRERARRRASRGTRRSRSRRRRPTWSSSASIPTIAAAFAAHLAASGVLITGTTQQRWVTHLDVARADVMRAIACVDAFFAGRH